MPAIFKNALFVIYRQIQSNIMMWKDFVCHRETRALSLASLWQLGGILLLTLLCACGTSASENRQTKQLSPPNLHITTYSQMIGGAAGNQSEAVQVSLEFKIAPVISRVPVQDKAIVALSDSSGQFYINLPPGKYWIGATEQLDNSGRNGSATVTIKSQQVEIVADQMTKVNVYRRGYAP